MGDWYQIENNSFIVQVNSNGAEIKRLFSRTWNRELLWLGDEKVWNRSSPILFPIVGALKDGAYQWGGKKYQLGQHGFARDTNFQCVECSSMEIEFKLEASQETFKVYPFLFDLHIQYKLDGDKLTIVYSVKNTDRQTIYFSIGAHPAFETKNIQDYEIQFQKEEKEYFQLNNGLVDWTKPHTLKNTVITLSPEVFQNDALIFKKLKSPYVDLVDKKRDQVIRVHSHTPFFGIWGKGAVPFVCLEPWHGVSDSADHNGQLQSKNGIIALLENEEFMFSYSIEMLKGEN